jgi:hypothetical protein
MPGGGAWRGFEILFALCSICSAVTRPFELVAADLARGLPAGKKELKAAELAVPWRGRADLTRGQPAHLDWAPISPPP